MKAIKLKINASSFLLPESHQFYEFPSYIQKHRSELLLYANAVRNFASDPMSDHFSTLPDMSDFKRITGIIGFPFDMNDADLYALDRKIQITMEFIL